MSCERWQWLCEQLWKGLEEDLKTGVKPPLRQVLGYVPQGERPRFEPGQMWIAEPEDGLGLTVPIVLTHVSSVIRGVVSTNDTFVAGHDDILVNCSDSPTASELLLCTWSDSPVDGDCLTEYVGEIGANPMRALLMYLQRRLTGDYKLRAIQAGRSFEEDRRVVWTIHSNGSPETEVVFETGPRILGEDDPRFKVREVISQGTLWIAERATEEVFSSEDSIELVAWHEQPIRLLSQAIAKYGTPRQPDFDWVPTAAAAAAGAFAIGGGMRMFAGVLSPAIGWIAGGLTGAFADWALKKHRRSRAAEPRWDSDAGRTAGVLKAGTFEVELDFMVLSETLYVRAKALSDGGVSKGVRISFVSGTKKLSAVTKKDGYAQLHLKEINHDFPSKFIIGGEEDQLVIDLFGATPDERVVLGVEQPPRIH